MKIGACMIWLTLFATLACMGVGGVDAPKSIPLRSIDGLDRADIDLPGMLDLREDHRIGSYDALLIPEASISYKRGSLRLSRDGERIFLNLLRETIVELTEAAAIPIHAEPGACVMEISLDVARMDVDTGKSASQLAEMMLVMQFRDSESRELLLRYATVNRVPSPKEGVTHDSQIRLGLREIVGEMNVAHALRGAGLADDAINPPCKGTLAARGRAAREQL